jgi:ribosomal protein S18 acetylase RimI-like enzyme
MSVCLPGIRARPARRDDIPSIVMISRTSIIEGEDVGFGNPVVESIFGNVDKLSAAWIEPNRIGTEEIEVAEIDGQVAGCVKIEERGDDLELVDIDVTRESQCQGIGTCLVRFVEGLAMERGKKSVTLGTSRNSAGVAWTSLSWWTSRGYRITHEEENDWTRSIGPGVREIRLRKNLQ